MIFPRFLVPRLRLGTHCLGGSASRSASASASASATGIPTQTKITDEALVQLQAMQKLQRLWLDNTSVTDAAIGHLVKRRSLVEQHIRGTKITQDGIEQLQRSLPRCQIEL